MNLGAFLRAVAEVPWRELEGAYGPSDGSGDRPAPANVPEALRVLATERDTESDEWMQALDDVLYAHVLHQGTIYPVTPHVFPLLLRLADELPQRSASLLAYAVAVFVQAAARWTEGVESESDGPSVALARRILASAREHVEVVLRWAADARADVAAAIVQSLPELRPRWLEVIEDRELSTVEFVVLASLPVLPPWAVTRAREALDGADEPRVIAAALIVARDRPAAPEVALRLDEVLRPGAEARLRDALELELPLPSFPRGPFTEFGGEVLAGQVLFVGAALTTIRLGGRNLTLRWVPAGVSKGDSVRVGMTTSARPCWIEWTKPEGEVERVELTADLTPV